MACLYLSVVRLIWAGRCGLILVWGRIIGRSDSKCGSLGQCCRGIPSVRFIQCLPGHPGVAVDTGSIFVGKDEYESMCVWRSVWQ